MSRVLIATDAWQPQVNGVVRTYEQLAIELPKLGMEVSFIGPGHFWSVPSPGYSEIRLAIARHSRLAAFVDHTNPDFIHIATEGPVGWAMRAFCRRRKLRFTTAYHTRFPEYLAAHFRIPDDWTRRAMRQFHRASACTMVATQSLSRELERYGFRRTVVWTRGVDTKLFRPRNVGVFGDEGPIQLYVGRVSVEKNITAFLSLDVPGKKVVVGDGPQLDGLRRSFPEVAFTGALHGEELAKAYASADVFVFPSRTDTFGLVLLEAMASGLPIAAYPVSGPLDIVTPGLTGVLDEDLAGAVRSALSLDRAVIRKTAMTFGWSNSAMQFMHNLVPMQVVRVQSDQKASRLVREPVPVTSHE
jgi:glycosyltransferase involved in cell wall biosynthesis